MSVRPDPRSPWGARIWIPDSDFDVRMDAVRESVPGTLFQPGIGVDVDLILMRAYGVDPDFTDDLPSDCLGRTSFLRDGRYRVEISRSLADEAVHSPVSRRRMRSTLAHECAHIVFHSVLHPVAAGPALFEEFDDRDSTVMCREPHVGASAIAWWEVQANRGMSCLLMPRPTVREQVSSWLIQRGLSSVSDALREERAEALVRDMANVFDVNVPVVVYRLQELGMIPTGADQHEFVFDER